ncbi:MAG: hypothetical protein NXI04_02735 [Planctomycetaceae bacterium]|nr:hypothetical protein [Planctomycetaceae bacterium]
MSDKRFQRLQRAVASACLLASTGCSTLSSLHLTRYDELPAGEEPMPASAQFVESGDTATTADTVAANTADPQFLGSLNTGGLGADIEQTAATGDNTTARDNPFAEASPLNPFVAEPASPFESQRAGAEVAEPANPFAAAAELAPQDSAQVNPFASEVASPPGDPAAAVIDDVSGNPFADAAAGSGEAVVQTADFEVPQALAVAYLQPASATATTGATPTFHPATPRMPTSGRIPSSVPGLPQQACPPCEVTIAAAGPEQAFAYPDEFIYDGGDRDVPVHYNGGVMAGLDTEDTVVEYSDSEGRNRVTPSNRVAVYAPRFGSVRTVSGLGVGTKVDQAAGAVDFAAPGGLSESRGIDATVAGTPAEGLRMRASASGVDVAVPASQSAQASAAAVNRKVDQGLESRVNTGLGTLEMTDIRELSLQIVDAATSTRRTSQIQTTGSTQATQTYATFRPQATIGVEQNRRKGEIFLTKKATPLIAQPGDTVTFTIEFSNIGDVAVSDVRIIDNLTPRLAYTSGTGQITVSSGGGGSLTVVPNKEGSQMVEFQLDQPLPGGATGTITFDALVQ